MPSRRYAEATTRPRSRRWPLPESSTKGIAVSEPKGRAKRTSASSGRATRRKRVIYQNPDIFFDKYTGLQVKTLCGEISKHFGPFAVGPHRELYAYQNGLWLPEGEWTVRKGAVALLGERSRPSHSTNAIEVFKANSQLISTDNTRYLNLPNGLFDWRTGELTEHDPAVGRIPRIPIEWDPDATCPAIDAWLPTVLREDSIETAFEFVGYCLYNGYPIHKAGLLSGAGRNGKGTFLRLITKLLGDNNVSAVTPQDLDSNRFMVAELYGKMANLIGDVDPKTFKVTERFKQSTGDDLMSAERKNGQPFTFRNKAFMIASFNKLPSSEDTTEGFLSRWIVLLFDVGYFPDGKADDSIEDKIGSPEELRGLLVKSVAGLQRVIGRHAFTQPESVRKATQEFRVSADSVRQFIQDELASSPRGFVTRPDLYERYEDWCRENARPIEPRREFYRRFREAANDVLGPGIREGKRGIEGFRGMKFQLPESRIKAART